MSGIVNFSYLSYKNKIATNNILMIIRENAAGLGVRAGSEPARTEPAITKPTRT
jgi:hypothetical protein